MKMSKSLLVVFIAIQSVGCINAAQNKPYSNLTSAQNLRLLTSKAFRFALLKSKNKAKAVQTMLLASAVANVDPKCVKKAQTSVAQSSDAPVIFVHSSTNTSAHRPTQKQLNMKSKHARKPQKTSLRYCRE